MGPLTVTQILKRCSDNTATLIPLMGSRHTLVGGFVIDEIDKNHHVAKCEKHHAVLMLQQPYRTVATRHIAAKYIGLAQSHPYNYRRLESS